MDVALIPPRGLENYALSSRFHLALALPSLLLRKPYTEMYKRASRLGDYVIVDNGAAEGESASTEDILAAAGALKAHEVVAPDAIQNSRVTIEMVMQFTHHLEVNTINSYQVMAVPQGTTWKHFTKCVNVFAEQERVGTVGIPRHMPTTVGQTAARIDLANWIQNKHPGRFEIHLLGANPVWLAEIRMASKYAPHIRSVDSSLPFNYAIAGYRLEEQLAKGHNHEVVRRDPTYFATDWANRINTALLRSNIQTFMKWAGNDNYSTPQSRAGSSETTRVS